MTRRTFFTALIGGLALPLFKPRTHGVPTPVAAESTRTSQFPTLGLVDREIGLDCLAVSLFYDHADESVPAPVVMSIERYMNAWKAVAWSEFHNVPVVFDAWLASALADRATVGDLLPKELWQPMAEMIARVAPHRESGIGSAMWDKTFTEALV